MVRKEWILCVSMFEKMLLFSMVVLGFMVGGWSKGRFEFIFGSF